MRARVGIRIGRRQVGPGHPCLVVAEAGINHDGDLRTALRLVDAAKEAGADAIKFQSFTPDRLIGTGHPWLHKFERWRLSDEAHRKIADHAMKRRIIFFSTPFDEERLHFLVNEIEVPAIKIGSGELTHFPLLSRAGRTGLPVILSTGASNTGLIRKAERALRASGCKHLVMLHCVSNYPTALADANLRTIPFLKRRFRPEAVGFSDHTDGPEASVMAVAMGASVIEKHFTLNVGAQGPDHRLSADPGTFKKMTRWIRRVEKEMKRKRLSASSSTDDVRFLGKLKSLQKIGCVEPYLGRPTKLHPESLAFRKAIRRGIYARHTIPKGSLVTEPSLSIIRPEPDVKGACLPADWERIIGREARKTIRKDEPILRKDLK